MLTQNSQLMNIARNNHKRSNTLQNCVVKRVCKIHDVQE